MRAALTLVRWTPRALGLGAANPNLRASAVASTTPNYVAKTFRHEVATTFAPSSAEGKTRYGIVIFSVDAWRADAGAIIVGSPWCPACTRSRPLDAPPIAAAEPDGSGPERHPAGARASFEGHRRLTPLARRRRVVPAGAKTFCQMRGGEHA